MSGHKSDCALHGYDTGDVEAYPPDGISHDGPCDCSKPDTQNDFILGLHGRCLKPLLEITIVSRQQAYRTAAWLVAMAFILEDDGTEHTYEEIKKAVDNT